ncbi:STAS domain-containing protein [Thermodesulforhabdus norvegica]|uniref:STAS domain-containing protein n=1 Tax=Thermodesulforhabdus norvegica TaxID=39841 RepID=A0A1I4QPD9_9BACT|nr:STAS domain-containing protein [Thermodesulforhabdus norvegica]SFM41968.1 STAS domain-containing protein [Thermodesulforhabdus norvegica]
MQNGLSGDLIDMRVSSSGTLSIEIRGRLTRYEVPRIYRRLKKELNSRAIAGVELNLFNVSTVDTAGVALFVALCREAKKRGISFKLKNPSEHAVRVIKLARLENLLLENRTGEG